MAISMTASTIAIVAAGGVPVKLHLHRKAEVEVRRIPAPSSFDELLTVITHLWGGSTSRRLVIEYVDDEGDRVQMSSAWEWEECLRLFREVQTRPGAPLVLHASKRKGPQRRSAGGAAGAGVSQATLAVGGDSSSDDDTVATAVAPTRISTGGSFVGAPRAAPPAAVAPPQPATPPQRPQPQPQPQSAPITPPATLPPKSAVPPVDLPRTVPAPAPTVPKSARLADTAEDMQRITIELLSNLFNCDAERVLCDPGTAAHAMAGVVVARRASDNTDEVHVDIDRAALRRQALAEGNRRIQNVEHVRAESLIKLASRVFPNDEMLLYNLACAYARQAKVDDAFGALRQAIEAGYANPEHAQRDTDLISLRADPRFNLFIRVMKKDPTAQLPPATVPPPAAATAGGHSDPVPTGALTPRGVNAKMFVEMFPGLSFREARELLVMNDNDMSKAVNQYLRTTPSV